MVGSNLLYKSKRACAFVLFYIWGAIGGICLIGFFVATSRNDMGACLTFAFSFCVCMTLGVQAAEIWNKNQAPGGSDE